MGRNPSTVRGIIEAAPKTVYRCEEWEYPPGSVNVSHEFFWHDGAQVDGVGRCAFSISPMFTTDPAEGLATFIATFDPEHVALMEAVVEGAMDFDGEIDAFNVCKALHALLIYRAEHGLTAGGTSAAEDTHE